MTLPDSKPSSPASSPWWWWWWHLLFPGSTMLGLGSEELDDPSESQFSTSSLVSSKIISGTTTPEFVDVNRDLRIVLIPKDAKERNVWTEFFQMVFPEIQLIAYFEWYIVRIAWPFASKCFHKCKSWKWCCQSTSTGRIPELRKTEICQL